ncbi:succinate dehydrogenase, cytochrome b556 subunit [Kushneria aurantia]|uniref:Succinate dehydrogenase cytochrome b556 subunit n=1 Tax=Kushneria aurantia TaxID=504092 RepID=A0ABV6G2Y0_9GAMM|nr:succinate dehydrogenase, cytochrome b556 subunit [Kushneria aurantia]
MKTQRPVSSDKRPVNLDLSSIHFPLPALISISHRVSGVLLFIGLIFMMWALQASLASPAGFQIVSDTLAHNFFARLVMWGLLSALGFHFVAGIRHLVMDIGYGETLEGGQQGARLTVIFSIVLMILAGVWVW